jgi:hypothetical protein
MKCPRCGNTICNCLLEDPGFLARAVGKQLRLSGSEAQGLTTPKSENTKEDAVDDHDDLSDIGDGPPNDSDDTVTSTKEPGWDQTPEDLCREIIRSIPWTDGEVVLEPFCGDGNFYNNLPECVHKDWCEIKKGRDFFEYQGTVDTIITNPPFRTESGGENLVVPCLERCLQVAQKRVIYFVNHKVFNALTPGRLKDYEEQGWHITHLSVWDVKKWFGRYYLIIWEKGKPSIIGYHFHACNGRGLGSESQGISAPLRGISDRTNAGDSAPSSSDNGKNLDLQNTETPPSLCQWIFERVSETGVCPHTILDPCAGRGNLTRPFRARAQVIEYEIAQGKDFFEARPVACDLVICNPPWGKTLPWLRKIVEVVGQHTPLVFISPALLLYGDKNGQFRRYLESTGAPKLNHTTALPRDTFVGVYCPGVILWLNLPQVRDVALVPSQVLIRRNDVDPGTSQS